ncbi:ETHYLENE OVERPRODUCING 3, 1-aminocyclopropane-1-carboxylate synthase 9 [Hibiscus trionum]|uniref:ETHYLENE OVERPRODUCING 3, 1-aminocyclopropane-1-carboxylate synthase 9 n=1 Tax=Hibiscus trionum TaxID=183268 RepID=A0A9W7LYL2_HIBTR|nr:ETHYLENE OVERPRODUCING 3, 1-aminocyclopropane-1-carboxylate synthase 9 [Hibiscus trionum]
MEAAMDRNLENTDMWNNIHIVYSLSKDLGLPGFRVGMIYSNNETVVSAATKMSSFGLVSSQTQFLLSNVLANKKFTSKYMKENQRRLKKRKEMLVSGLKKSGIECLKSNAGLFCWVNMRRFLSSNTFEAETKLWSEIISDARLNISPGSSFHCTEPGWFRVCFANMSRGTLQVAMRRIKDFVERSSVSGGIKMSNQQNVSGLSRKLLSNWVRKLSSANRDEQER